MGCKMPWWAGAEKAAPTKHEKQIAELQRQIAEAQEVGRNLSSTWKSTEDELKRQLAELKAVIEKLREVFEAARQLLRYSGIDKERTRDAADRLDAAIEEVKKLDESDHTALDEAIKQAKVEVLEEAAYDLSMSRHEVDEAAQELRRMADEIRRS